MPLVTQYTFNPQARTITLTGMGSIDPTLPLSIDDVTLGRILYAGGPPKATISGNVITLPYDSIPGGATSGDQLNIYYGVDAALIPSGLPVTGIEATGSPSNVTYLRGDGTWSTPAGGSGLSAPAGAGMVKSDGTILADAVAGTDYVAPGGALGTPSSGNLSNCTSFPTLNQNTTGSAASLTTPRTIQVDLTSGSGATFNGTAAITPGVSGALPVGHGGTGATALTGLVKGNGSSAMTAAGAGTDYLAPGGALGTPSSGNLVNATFPTLNQNTTGSAETLATSRSVQTNLASTSAALFDGSVGITPGVSGTLAVPNGGTGATSLTGLVKGTGTAALIAATAGTDYLAPGGALGTPSSATLTNGTGLPLTGVTTSANGVLKGNGSGVIAAVSGTDYAPPTSGSALLKGNGSGGFSSATAGTDYAPITTGSSLLKGNGAGGFSSAVARTDYAPITTGTALLKGDGSGGFSTAVSGTDYQRVYWVNVLDHGADPTGVADSTTAFTNSFAALPSTGGWVYAPTGVYKLTSTVTVVQLQSLRGDGKGITTLKYTGTGPCIFATNTTALSSSLLVNPVGLEGFTVDGSGAGTGAIGIQLGASAPGDALNGAFAHEVSVQHFNTTGGVGWNLFNTSPGITCEQNRFTQCNAHDCATGVVFDGGNGFGSWDYSVFEFTISGNANRSFMTVQNKAQLLGCRLSIRGNAGAGTGNTAWVLGIDPLGAGVGASAIINCEVDISVESNLSGTAHQSLVMQGASSNFSGTGVLNFFSASTTFQGASIRAGCRFGFSGLLNDPVLGTLATGDGFTVQGGSQWSVWGNATTLWVSGATISPQLGDVQEYLLNGGAHTIGAITDGGTDLRARRMELILHQPASGAAATLTWPGNVTWLGNNTLSTTNGATDKVVLTYSPSAATWYAVLHTTSLGGKTLINPTITGYTETVQALGTLTTSATLSLTGGTIITATLTAATTCVFTMPTAVAGQSFVMILHQASTPTGLATFTGVKWAGGVTYVATSTASATDSLTFFSDGTNWYGNNTKAYS